MATKNITSIYNPALREELRLYTRELLDMVQRTCGVDMEAFAERFATLDGVRMMGSERCNAYTKNTQGIITLCMKPCMIGHCHCEDHGKDMKKGSELKSETKKNKSLVLEYIKTDKGEFLYDPDTTDVYSYTEGPNKPDLIGRMDIDTNTIICL
jgi:hypothetical protein